MSQLMRLWYLSHRQPASLRCSHTWSMEVDNWVWPKIIHLAPLDGCTCRMKSAKISQHGSNSLWNIWATSWQNQQNGMCTQRRLRSAAWRKKKAWVLSYPWSAQWRLLLVLSWGGSFNQTARFSYPRSEVNPNNSSYCEGLRRINLQFPHPKLDDNAPRGKLLRVFKQSEHAKRSKA